MAVDITRPLRIDLEDCGEDNEGLELLLPKSRKEKSLKCLPEWWSLMVIANKPAESSPRTIQIATTAQRCTVTTPRNIELDWYGTQQRVNRRKTSLNDESDTVWLKYSSTQDENMPEHQFIRIRSSKRREKDSLYLSLTFIARGRLSPSSPWVKYNYYKVTRLFRYQQN